MRKTTEDLKEASGRGDREDWFKEEGYSKLSKVER